jgi:ATP-dependent Clp protease ATP-binding subunit ClpA
MDRFSDRARKVVQFAKQESERLGHNWIGTEHLLLGLVKEDSGVAAMVLKSLGVDLGRIRREVEVMLGQETKSPIVKTRDSADDLVFTIPAETVHEWMGHAAQLEADAIKLRELQFTEQIATQLFVGMIAKPHGVNECLRDYAEMAKEAVELARRAAPFLVAELIKGAA